MIGRHAEIALLRGMIAESGAGQGNAIVVYGQAGIGKSALLAEVARTAVGDPLVLRVTGVEAEAELPFAALHMLLGPARQLIAELPAAQRDALRGAFGQSEGGAQDRFLVGLAVLTLLADLAGERNAGWRDRSRRGERFLRGRVDPRAARSTCGCEGREEEAIEWAKRVPAAPGSKIEVRRVAGSDEVPQVDQ
ncbi:ATP-binding protein [Nonomuraea sp. NPDC049158]|uniref:ATP-binding protein n=1 Tax=Nonomuraea sp. NPDC049158 TaxID=3155649 RepID=UPI0033DBD8C5